MVFDSGMCLKKEFMIPVLIKFSLFVSNTVSLLRWSQWRQAGTVYQCLQYHGNRRACVK